MAIGVVTEEDFEKELKKTPEVVIMPSPGRKEGDNNVPESLRKIIGETSVIDGRQEALTLAKAFGISASSTSAYAVGASSTASYDKPKKDIKDHIELSKKKIARSASQKLKLAIAHLTEDKLIETKAKDLSGVARDMAAVMKDMSPEVTSEGDGFKGPQFVIYAPQFRDERQFETIVVQE